MTQKTDNLHSIEVQIIGKWFLFVPTDKHLNKLFEKHLSVHNLFITSITYLLLTDQLQELPENDVLYPARTFYESCLARNVEQRTFEDSMKFIKDKLAKYNLLHINNSTNLTDVVADLLKDNL